jgi:hypothetical protein
VKCDDGDSKSVFMGQRRYVTRPATARYSYVDHSLAIRYVRSAFFGWTLRMRRHSLLWMLVIRLSFVHHSLGIRLIRQEFAKKQTLDEYLSVSGLSHISRKIFSMLGIS